MHFSKKVRVWGGGVKLVIWAQTYDMLYSIYSNQSVNYNFNHRRVSTIIYTCISQSPLPYPFAMTIMFLSIALTS